MKNKWIDKFFDSKWCIIAFYGLVAILSYITTLVR